MRNMARRHDRFRSEGGIGGESGSQEMAKQKKKAQTSDI